MPLSDYHAKAQGTVPLLPICCSVVDFLRGLGLPMFHVKDRLSAVFGGGEPGFFSEHAREVAGVGETAEFADLGDR